MVRHKFLSALVVALLAVGIGLPIWAHSRATGADKCTLFSEGHAARAALVTGSGERVLVVGDSYSAGYKVDLGQSWPTRLPGEIHVDGFSGSGFSRHASPCGDESYATRAARSLTPGTALVVVEGGLNDYRQPDAAIRAGFDRLMTVLEGHRVVVVGPPPAPLRLEGAVHVDGVLSRLSRAAGVPYVSMIDVRYPYLPDRLHLTPAGHRDFGDLVAAEIERSSIHRSEPTLG